MFTLRQLANRFANISFQEICSPTSSTFSTNNISNKGDKGTKDKDDTLHDGLDDRNLPRVVDVDMDTMFEDDDDDTNSEIKSERILPDNVKAEIKTKIESQVENFFPVQTHDDGRDDNDFPVLDVDTDEMMEEDDDELDIIYLDKTDAVNSDNLLLENEKERI
ncbi:uncharacterized protein LOC119670454 isoform X2 [Teleopsis dalmanni]|uniref:uncharacterized protein LOC119670454 isoform X1 n=1 Tax=Teleopsis dalmanni TaxID=139649 RepID=UPI0018CEFDC2|nr:uncharacterized protein LOC119670454 isoform X1 [Teleopsis dalmanni]XP_037936648.1 uncharacterized protein LOC119670454 isoform X2 [Teleopsis dalmanni]